MKRVILPTLILTAFVLSACQPRTSDVVSLDTENQPTQGTQTIQTTQGAEMPDYRGDITELKIEDTVVGTGQEVKAGDTILVHYTGTLIDGTVFDSSKRRGEPISFGIGIGQVIQGWDQGIVGMKEGGTRVLRIPPEMGYGARGAGAAIPPNASLIFEVELIEIQ